MSSEVLLGPAKTVALLHRADADGTLSAAASVTTGKARLVGLARLRGTFQADQEPAAGYPRVRQSHDGTTYDIVQVIPRDFSQGNYTYSFDLALQRDYAIVEWTQGGAQASWLRATVNAVAGIFGAPNVLAGSTSGVLSWLRSDKDSHFADAITQHEHEFENLTGLPSNVGRIVSVSLLADENLDYELHFWSSDDEDDADLDADSWLGSVDLPQTSGKIISGAQSTYRYSAEVNLPYYDGDGTNELHVSLVPRSAAKSAGGGGAGDVVLIVGFQPE